ALGATLYELLTSRPPFYTGNITHQVMDIAPPPIEERLVEFEIQNDVPADARALVMACLSKDPAQRPQSARAVAEWIGLETGTDKKTGALVSPVSRPQEADAPAEAEAPEEPMIAAEELAGT